MTDWPSRRGDQVELGSTDKVLTPTCRGRCSIVTAANGVEFCETCETCDEQPVATTLPLAIPVATALWARASGDNPWCAVLRETDAIIRTRCASVFDAKRAQRASQRPPVADRCVPCQGAYAAHQLDELAAACGDPSRRHAVELSLRELAYGNLGFVVNNTNLYGP